VIDGTWPVAVRSEAYVRLVHDDLDGCRNDLYVALILAGVGDGFRQLVDAIDVYVAPSVLSALEDPPEIPF
jgi:hypothetical protein